MRVIAMVSRGLRGWRLLCGFFGFGLMLAVVPLFVLNWFAGGRPSILGFFGYTPCPRPDACDGIDMIGPITLLTGNPVWWDVFVLYGVLGLGVFIVVHAAH
jgi:hypothetical protein